MISRCRSLIQRNLPAKIVALLIAVILWGYVMNDQNPTTEGVYTVQVQMVNAPEGYKISQSVHSVKIKVRGPRSLFVANNESDFHAYVDLKDAEDGKHAYKVQVDMPQGFELTEVKPGSIDVMLDRIIAKKVRADINVNGAPAPGESVAKVNQADDKVLVEGPASAVNEVERVIGYVGITSKNDKDFDLQVPLTAINADGKEVQGVTVKPATMYVAVILAHGLTKKTVNVNPVTVDDLPSGYEIVSLKVDPAYIEIAGKDKLLANINTIDTEKLSLVGINKNTNRTLKLNLPEGVTAVNREVDVHIVIRQKKG